MSAFANLSLKNQAAVETVFAPANIDPSTKVAAWLGAGVSLDSRNRASLSVILPSGSGTRVKIRGKVSIPVMDPVLTTQKVDESIATFEFSLPKNAVLGQRQDLRAFIADFLVDPTVIAAIENYESIY